ncbi:hypothetical protein OIU85_023059 [Salix viminalis]|uniref:Uncharacterized protein n=1 Tax=Salix viminalis TaxID=40686 RepID=A0A9Q0Z8A9_SALVM|nr:hypothetical protein OIU85_023059 [Salix viminalis]
MKHDPEVSREVEQSSTNMLKDELRLSEEEAQKKQQRADLALLEAKRMTSQYQKEAEKCNSGMDSCEEAREKAEDAVEEQGKLTAIWELRARERGWREGIKRIMEMFIVQMQLRKFEIQFKDNIFNVLLYDEDEILRWFCKEEEEEGRMIISNQIMKSSHPTADHQTVKVSQPTGIAMMMMIYIEPKQK